jgi:regulatory protein YycI of two-component signal transduction system YycFG
LTRICRLTISRVTDTAAGKFEAITMSNTETGRSAGHYERAAIYHGDSDCVEYVQYDGFVMYERVDGFLTLVKDATDNLVGFKLKGFRNMVERLKPSLELSDKQFLSLISAIEVLYSHVGDALIKDEKRAAGYRAAYLLAANDNVRLTHEELRAA